MIEIEKLPTSGQVAIDIHVSATVNVSAFSAKQKVTRFVASHISTHMHGGEPKMVVNDRIVWRVPIIFSMAPQGDRGVVGEVDVDVETGATQISQALIEGIKERARRLALHPPSPTATTG